MPDISWMLPATAAAYEHRDAIANAWSRVTTAVLGRRSSIAITGMGGVGKTVLLDHLTSRAYQPNYRPPGLSPDVERGGINRDHKRIRFTVLPGQDSPERWESVDDLFLKEDPPDGVIHVVCNGFGTVRSSVGAAELVATGGLNTIEAFRSRQKAAEIADLGRLCEQIRTSVRRHRRPSWLLIAVAKIDLYYKEVLDAERYYSAEFDSAFSAELRSLQGNVGRDNLTWEAVPVCTWLEDFVWNQETTPSVLKPDARDHFVAQLARAIERRCRG